MEERVKCKKCGTAILLQTAERNEGLCKPCYYQATDTKPVKQVAAPSFQKRVQHIEHSPEALQKQTVYCPGCGDEITCEVTCPACSEPTTRAKYHEIVYVRGRGQISLPDKCCCCLKPADRIITEAHKTQGNIGGEEVTLSFPMPWCKGCRFRSRIWRLILWSVFLGLWLVASAITAVIRQRPFLDWSVIIIGLFVSLFLFVFLWTGGLSRLLPPYRRPGHTEGCSGFSVDKTSRSGATLVLHNRAFADIWRRMNPE